jgi:cytoskeletal protein CcmA (bactofilin family)
MSDFDRVIRFARPAAKSSSWGALAVCACLTLAACDSAYDSNDETNKVNGSIHVAAGKPAESVNTVNGGIHIDDNAAVESAGTVNGSIHLGAHATAKSMRTVNGGITAEDDAHASEMKSVNGDLTVKEGADVSGALVNVNGKISVAGAHIGGTIKTVNANITITGPSHVDGGIVVEKANSVGFFNNEVPTIIIGPGATVKGELKFERKVRLFVSDRATIGTVTGASPVTFTGDNPPSTP